MDLLQQARAEIDAVDAEMAALFERRMQAVADVVRYKAETGKPVFDAAREADVITRNTARLQNEELRPYYKAFLQEAMAVSRAYQRATLGRDTAAYQGVEGAWSHIALRRMFPFARATAFATWPEVFDAVQNGDAQFGVLPFENSNAGDVSAVLDLSAPIAELMFCDFLTVGMDQLVNQAAKMRYMFGGKISLPMVVRLPCGAGVGAAAQHSQSLEAWMTHVPGLKVVYPSTPQDALGLMLSSIDDDNPVMLLSTRPYTPSREMLRASSLFRSARATSSGRAAMSR